MLARLLAEAHSQTLIDRVAQGLQKIISICSKHSTCLTELINYIMRAKIYAKFYVKQELFQ